MVGQFGEIEPGGEVLADAVDDDGADVVGRFAKQSPIARMMPSLSALRLAGRLRPTVITLPVISTFKQFRLSRGAAASAFPMRFYVLDRIVMFITIREGVNNSCHPCEKLPSSLRKQDPYVDGPLVAEFVRVNPIACDHMSGLLSRSHMTAAKMGSATRGPNNQTASFANGSHGLSRVLDRSITLIYSSKLGLRHAG